MTIKDLKIGETAIVTEVGGEGALRQHFLDMGMIPGTVVKVVKYAPMGDPVQLMIHGYDLTLRLADAEKITVAARTQAGEARKETDSEGAEGGRKSGSRKKSRTRGKEKESRSGYVDHPGLGEGGKYHDPTTENKLPEGTKLTFALAGNQNSGKTTLFNQLTGSNQHVGNFPGVTVDRKDGVIRRRSNTLITDLPGIYSMSPYSSEEIVTVHPPGASQGNHQYRGRHQHRAQPVSDHAADGARHSHGPGPQHDGRDEKERRQYQDQCDGGYAGDPGRSHRGGDQ